MSAAMTVLKISGKVNPAKGGQNTKKKNTQKKKWKRKMKPGQGRGASGNGNKHKQLATA